METEHISALPKVPAAPPASSQNVRASMIGNRSQNTKPELIMRAALTDLGIQDFELHPSIPGTPDIAFEAEKIAVFINGCYWHRCPHCRPHFPKTNQEYWSAKFARNKSRDRRNAVILKELGWKVLVVWECKVRKNSRRQARRVHAWLSKRSVHHYTSD